jgi:indole-3-glycerol phosphate synthase
MKEAQYLDRILEVKRREVAENKLRMPLDDLHRMPGFGLQRRSLRAALQSHRPAVIAEIKFASPSKGFIRRQGTPGVIARGYASNGASAISVLTDRTFFQGDLGYLLPAREGHSLPVLRKDFIIDPYQLHEAKAYGADAVLLIVAALGAPSLRSLKEEAERLGLEVLVEIHTLEELEAIEEIPIDLLGINNRDLSTFATSIETTCSLSSRVPSGTTIVSESGIHGGGDMLQLQRHGVNAALIGEAFMRAADPGKALAGFLAECGSGAG